MYIKVCQKMLTTFELIQSIEFDIEESRYLDNSN